MPNNRNNARRMQTGGRGRTNRNQNGPVAETPFIHVIECLEAGPIYVGVTGEEDKCAVILTAFKALVEPHQFREYTCTPKDTCCPKRIIYISEEHPFPRGQSLVRAHLACGKEFKLFAITFPERPLPHSISEHFNCFTLGQLRGKMAWLMGVPGAR